MVLSRIELGESYWNSLVISPKDIEYLYSFLLDKETPLPSDALAEALINEHIRFEKDILREKQQQNGDIYYPKVTYTIGDKLQFPALDWLSGKVTEVRAGNNPEQPAMGVITVALENGQNRQFASNLEDHKLNQVTTDLEDTDEGNTQDVINQFIDGITEKLDLKLEENKDLVRIGADWFPKSLLIEFNIGHLNLAEAVLDMHGGGPLPADSLLEQLEIDTDDPAELVCFSLNYALQEDPRFDEVGTKGIVRWFLNRLEPTYVRERPVELSFTPVDYDHSVLSEDMLMAEQHIDDELTETNPEFMRKLDPKEASVALSYPHWRMGTLPLTAHTRPFFPTALETPRVEFKLIDDKGDEISAWVVRPYHYVYGLQEWYRELELMPGSVIKIQHGKNPGEVMIQPEKKRSNREWIRTLLIGTDGGIVFAMLKQMITADFNERMAIAVPSTDVLDELWQKRVNNPMPLKNVMMSIMNELAKLNQQGHVHAIELYAALNCVRRCPPGLLFSMLASNPEFTAVGDLYFRLSQNS